MNFKIFRKSDVIVVANGSHLEVPLVYVISRLFRKPLIFDPMHSLHSNFIGFNLLARSSPLAKILKIIDRIIFFLPDVILFDTEISRGYYRKLFHIPLEKTKILYLGADDSVYKYSGINLNKTKLFVVYYGLYNIVHGGEHIIECANLCRENRDIEFLMIGKGQTYAENKKRAEELKLENIKFLPEVTEKDARQYLENGDIFLGFLNASFLSDISVPNKVFQGLAMGKVVITADSAVTRFFFEHKENIYLCAPSDANALYKGIMELKNDINLRKNIASKGYELYKEKFTPEIISYNLKIICEELINEK